MGFPSQQGLITKGYQEHHLYMGDVALPTKSQSNPGHTAAKLNKHFFIADGTHVNESILYICMQHVRIYLYMYITKGQY